MSGNVGGLVCTPSAFSSHYCGGISVESACPGGTEHEKGRHELLYCTIYMQTMALGALQANDAESSGQVSCVSMNHIYYQRNSVLYIISATGK